MKRVEELGISPHPWIADGSFVSSEDGNVCLTIGHEIEMDDKERANARLIAASPELYEALRSAVIQMCHDCPLCDYADGDYRCKEEQDKCFVNKWREVLAKASGEEAK